MKTIKQALEDDIHYPVGSGIIENKLIKRGLQGESEYTTEVANDRAYKGALADCLYSLIEAPNFSEADKNISLGDRNLILKKVNSIYTEIGEETKGEKPKVRIGGWQYLNSKRT